MGDVQGGSSGTPMRCRNSVVVMCSEDGIADAGIFLPRVTAGMLCFLCTELRQKLGISEPRSRSNRFNLILAGVDDLTGKTRGIRRRNAGVFRHEVHVAGELCHVLYPDVPLLAGAGEALQNFIE